MEMTAESTGKLHKYLTNYDGEEDAENIEENYPMDHKRVCEIETERNHPKMAEVEHKIILRWQKRRIRSLLLNCLIKVLLRLRLKRKQCKQSRILHGS